MSFNPNDNNPLMISRNNYEEYFLLYIDNELNEEERKAVDAFVQLHPDLQAELEILMTTKLPAEDISLAGKETLFADSMKLNAIDESLLLYIDDELKGKEKKIVEQKIEKDKNYQLQHQLLLRTKLDKSEQIIYPYKDELYRREEKRRTPTYWMRAAAAIIIALGIGVLVWTANNNKAQVDVTQGPNKAEIKKNDIEANIIKSSPQTNDQNLVKSKPEDKKPETTSESVRLMAVSGKTKDEKKQDVITKEVKQEEHDLAGTTKNTIAVQDQVKKDDHLTANNHTSDNLPKQTFNNPDVTTTSSNSYNNQTASTTAVFKDVAVDNEKKSSLKGLLRKATRFIERRTNIKATNENDELLIGAVAIQL